jgi:hypothetical protein
MHVDDGAVIKGTVSILVNSEEDNEDWQELVLI